MQMFLKSNLKVLRKNKGITQEQLAFKLGKVRTTIVNWENGVSVPNLDEIDKMTILFDVSGEDFLFRDLSGVHLTEKSKKGAAHENVHRNVHPGVHLKTEIPTDSAVAGTSTPGSENPYKEALKMNEYLGIAIKGLEAANSMLIKDLELQKEEIRLLKKGIPNLGQPLDDIQKRTAG